jgi:hypothetical protein
MAGVGTHRCRRATLVVLALAAALVVPAPAAADEGTFVLPGISLAVVPADLDGDGEREIVRLVQGAGTLVPSVDAWRHDGTGWVAIGELQLPAVTFTGGRSPAAAALLRSSVAGDDRVLVITAGIANAADGSTCCLAIAEIRPASDGGIALRPLEVVGGRGGQSMHAVDLDADGTDELVLHEARFSPDDRDGTAVVSVMRRIGSAFEEIHVASGPELLNSFVVAESDGVAGIDLLYGPVPDGRLHRLSWVEGELRAEEAHVDVGGPPAGWIAGVAGGRIVVVVDDAVISVSWPRGREATAARRSTRSYPTVAIVGEGSEALVMTQDSFGLTGADPPRAAILDRDLRELGELPAGAGAEAFWRLIGSDPWARGSGLQHNVFPFFGPFPGTLPGGESAFIANGTLVVAGGVRGYETRPMSSLIGMQPAGLAGPDDGFVVLSDAFQPASSSAYLSWGGVPVDWGRVAVTPQAELFRPNGAADGPSVALRGAVEVTGEAEVPVLMADGDGFEISVSAAPGSTVILSNDGRISEHRAADEPLVIDVVPRGADDEERNEPFETSLYVIGPDGRGTAREWAGTFVREPPEVSVTAATDPLSLSATLSGRVSRGSQVTANGTPITIDPDGRFAATIDAPIWPSQVLVAARDPLGNEATRQVEVVGMVDYRGLPWPALLVSATLGVGALFYLRTPRGRPRPSAPGDDARLEELELDAIDAVEPGAR